MIGEYGITYKNHARSKFFLVTGRIWRAHNPSITEKIKARNENITISALLFRSATNFILSLFILFFLEKKTVYFCRFFTHTEWLFLAKSARVLIRVRLRRIVIWICECSLQQYTQRGSLSLNASTLSLNTDTYAHTHTYLFIHFESNTASGVFLSFHLNVVFFSLALALSIFPTPKPIGKKVCSSLNDVIVVVPFVIFFLFQPHAEHHTSHT